MSLESDDGAAFLLIFLSMKRYALNTFDTSHICVSHSLNGHVQLSSDYSSMFGWIYTFINTLCIQTANALMKLGRCLCSF